MSGAAGECQCVSRMKTKELPIMIEGIIAASWHRTTLDDVLGNRACALRSRKATNGEGHLDPGATAPSTIGTATLIRSGSQE